MNNLECPNNSGPKLGNNSIWHLIKSAVQIPDKFITEMDDLSGIKKISNARSGLETKKTGVSKFSHSIRKLFAQMNHFKLINRRLVCLTFFGASAQTPN